MRAVNLEDDADTTGAICGWPAPIFCPRGYESSGWVILLGGVGGRIAIRPAGDLQYDQGLLFTDQKFTSRLAAESIAISMDGKGRAIDNVMIERLWRKVKYENLDLKDYASRLVASVRSRTLLRYARQNRIQIVTVHGPGRELSGPSSVQER